MERPAPSGCLTVTVAGLSGNVLLGPREAVDAAESVRGLKRRLPDDQGQWRLLFQGRELMDDERLARSCEPGAENAMTAVLVKTAAVELNRLAEARRERGARLQRDSERWLAEAAAADEATRRQRREEDVDVYRQAMAALLQQLEEEVLVHCRRKAREGQVWCTFAMDNLQGHELGAKFFFRRERPIRADPVMRGWYLCTECAADASGDPADVPETLKMGDGRNHQFINALVPDLVRQLEEQGLRVLPGSYFGMLQVAWGSEADTLAAGMETVYERWW